jgi:hypothetical protein
VHVASHCFTGEERRLTDVMKFADYDHYGRATEFQNRPSWSFSGSARGRSRTSDNAHLPTGKSRARTRQRDGAFFGGTHDRRLVIRPKQPSLSDTAHDIIFSRMPGTCLEAAYGEGPLSGRLVTNVELTGLRGFLRRSG